MQQAVAWFEGRSEGNELHPCSSSDKVANRLPGETLLSSYPQPDDSLEFANGMWGGKTKKCVKASLEMTVLPPIVMIVVHHESTWVG